MAKRIMKDGVELIKTVAGKGRGGSRPKPPKAVVRSASLEAPLPLADHEKAKRCLTAKTVAFSTLFTLWLSITQAVGLASRPIWSRHST
jgi:hypothetical protein